MCYGGGVTASLTGRLVDGWGMERESVRPSVHVCVCDGCFTTATHMLQQHPGYPRTAAHT